MNRNAEVLFKEADNTSRKGLTERETEYLALAAMGFKNKEIAEILSVTKSTVKKTFESVFQKIFAKDRANAVAIAFLHDILNGYTLHNIIKKYNIKIENLHSSKRLSEQRRNISK